MGAKFKIRSGSPAHWALRGLGVLIVLGIALWIPTKATNGTIAEWTDAYILMIAAMALNLVLGYTGMISIGHSAFFGVGAYTTGIAISRWGWNPWYTFLLGFAVAFVVGMVVSLPALRIKGIYLALVTLSIALIFPAMMKWKKLEWLTGGGQGLKKTTFPVKMKRFKIFGHDFFGNISGVDGKTVFHYWIALVFVVITYFVCRGLVKSRVGRALVAIRDNETAAAVMGVPLALTKALIFGMSAGLCSFAGSISAIRTGNVVPDSGNILIFGAIAFLVVMVIGGAGTLWGPIIGAVAYTQVSSATSDWADDEKIPGLLRPLLGWSKFAPSTGVFAVALIALMFTAPFGLVGLWNRTVSKLVGIIPAPAGATAIEPATDGPAPAPDSDALAESSTDSTL